MNRLFWLLLLPGLIGASIAACTAPSSDMQPPESKATSAVIPGKESWQQNWDKILADGKKEGIVEIPTTLGGESRTELTRAFKDKYGIDLEFSPAARGAELTAKIKAEQNAGLYLHDFFVVGQTTALMLLKPDGLLGPIEPLLILPEVTEPRYWREGRFPFLDADKRHITFAAVKQIYIVYNTDLVKEGEITSYKDVLKPQYKGRITLNDPTVTGAGNGMMTHLSVNVWSVEEANDFLRQLVKQQEAVIQRDNRMHVESVARGKYAIAVGAQSENVNNMINDGAPIGVAKLKEGYLYVAGTGAISAVNKLAHPNAAAVFLNWLLTREGQTVFSRSFGAPSMRIDVPTAGINPASLFQPDDKLFPYDEKMAIASGERTAINKRVIEEAMK